jgi:tetratricopeptide (TPR) repeat protein
MVWFGFRERSIGIVSFPLECPDCGRETMHTYSMRGKDPVFLRLTVPVGLLRPCVQCHECKLTRRVPRRDRRRIRRLAQYRPKAYLRGCVAGEYVDTSLGRACGDPERMIRYMPKMGARRATIVVALVVLLGCPAVTHNALQVAAETEADILVDRSVRMYEAGRWRDSLLRLRVARLLYWFADNSVREAECLLGIGALCTELEQYDRALRAYDHSLAMWQDINDHEMVATCYIAIGYARWQVADLFGALHAYQASLSHWRDAQDWEAVAGVTRRIGVIYEALEQYSDALEAYEEALRLFEKLRDDVAAAELRIWIDRIRQSLPGYKRQEEANWPDDRGRLTADRILLKTAGCRRRSPVIRQLSFV